VGDVIITHIAHHEEGLHAHGPVEAIQEGLDLTSQLFGVPEDGQWWRSMPWWIGLTFSFGPQVALDCSRGQPGAVIHLSLPQLETGAPRSRHVGKTREVCRAPWLGLGLFCSQVGNLLCILDDDSIPDAVCFEVLVGTWGLGGL
jgi:hypothetical protein